MPKVVLSRSREVFARMDNIMRSHRGNATSSTNNGWDSFARSDMGSVWLTLKHVALRCAALRSF